MGMMGNQEPESSVAGFVADFARGVTKHPLTATQKAVLLLKAK